MSQPYAKRCRYGYMYELEDTKVCLYRCFHIDCTLNKIYGFICFPGQRIDRDISRALIQDTDM